jgi:hypothetical protein
MCRFASFVLTKDTEFWSDKTDSHEDIIATHSLTANGAAGPNILRVEISPVGPLDGPFEKWEYKVDQDLLPKWHDAAKCEARTRAALVRRFPNGIPAEYPGSLDLRDSKVTSLGKLASVGGSLNLSGSEVTSLGKLASVGGSLYLRGSKVTSLGKLASVGGSLDLSGSKVTVPPTCKVNGTVYG